MTRTARIDRSDWRQQRRGRAVLLSVFLHLCLILGIAMVASWQPRMPTVEPDAEPVELTMVELTPAAEKRFLQTTESQRADKPPPTAQFESDKDTRAASPLPARGDDALPTQEGEDRPGAEFENREYTAGDQPRPSSPPSPQELPAPPAQPAPEKAPARQPELSPKPPASEIALLQPVRPKTQPTEDEALRPKPRPTPRPPAPPGYQPQTRVTRLKGNINNRGRSSVAAAATPLGRYKQELSDAIGSRWYYYVNRSIGLLNTGTVEIRFVVGSDGTVQRVEVLSNSSNESFAATSVRAVRDAELPPIPEELLPMLNEGRLEIDYTFTILPN